MTVTFDQKSTVPVQLPGTPALVIHSSFLSVIKYLLGASTIPNAEIKQKTNGQDPVHQQLTF